MKHTYFNLMPFFFLFCAAGVSCSKNKCHTVTLVWRNDTNDKITVLVYTKGEKDMAARNRASFRIRPGMVYQYDVSKYSELPFIESEISIATCI